MAMKSTEKLIDGLSQLLEGFAELQESIELDYRGEDELEEEENDESELSIEVDAAIVTEIRAVIEAVMENEEYATEEVAALISTITDALEEIDPDVFEESDEDEETTEVSESYNEDDDYYDEYEEIDDDLEDFE